MSAVCSGKPSRSSVVNNWSGSSAENARSPGGVVPGRGATGSTPFEQTYWGLEISGIPSSALNTGIGVANLQTLSVSAWDDAWANLDDRRGLSDFESARGRGRGLAGRAGVGSRFRSDSLAGDQRRQPGRTRAWADQCRRRRALRGHATRCQRIRIEQSRRPNAVGKLRIDGTRADGTDFWRRSITASRSR